MFKVIGFVLLAVATCSATSMQYPQNNSCIMMDITVDNTLSWTDATTGNTTFAPNWNFADSKTTSGSCEGLKDHEIYRHWDDDGATYTFVFLNNSGAVSLNMSLAFSPDRVFKNGKKASVTVNLEEMSLSSDDKAFLCKNVKLMKGSTTTSDNDTYEMTVQIKSIHVQAFGLDNETFSEDEECTADAMTTEPPQTTKHTTEPPTKPTTQPPTTQHTTEPVTNKTVTTNPTTPAPTPSSSHPKQNVSVMNDGVTCILLLGQFLFTIPYNTTNGTTKSVQIGVQDVNKSLTTGNCNKSSDINKIEINFLKDWMLTLAFEKEGSGGMLGADDDTKYWWSMLDLTYKLDDKTFPDHRKNESDGHLTKVFDKGQFQATVSGSYLCKTDSTLDLGDGYKLETWDLQYKAFQSDNSTSFSDNNVQECSADAKTNSIVPIAVGAALAGLVVIVLIAYLIGRRRNRKGYESV